MCTACNLAIDYGAWLPEQLEKECDLQHARHEEIIFTNTDRLTDGNVEKAADYATWH